MDNETKVKTLLELLQKIERNTTPYSKWIGQTSNERELIALLKLNLELIQEVIEKAQP
jgi:hypothetical protein